MKSESFLCPHCGQSNVASARLSYCSFCYVRFQTAEASEVTDSAAGEATVGQSEPADSETPAVESTPAEVAASETAAAPRPVSYTSKVCPHCLADLLNGEQTCPICLKGLDEDWI